MFQKIKRTICACFGCALLLGASAQAANQVPILMYHNLTTDASQTSSMTITDTRFRLDMEFLEEYGYTPLLPSQLVQIRSGMMAMPEKPVMITFDDGYNSVYTLAYPILQTTNMKGTISVIASAIVENPENETESNKVSWAQLREMYEAGTIEVGSHTDNLHNSQHAGQLAPDGINGVMRVPGETQVSFEARVGTDLANSIVRICGGVGQDQVLYFSYPYGAYDSWMDGLLNQVNIPISTLTREGTANIASGLRNLPRYHMNMEQSAASVLRQADAATASTAQVTIGGTHKTLQSYMIGGNNYVRVRDVALLLDQSAAAFNVGWNDLYKCVQIENHVYYQPNGGENALLHAGSRTVYSNTGATIIDNTPRTIASYNIDGNVYYKLRSLADWCDFSVDWDEASSTVVINA